jgi:hypothetical protein
MAQETLYPLDVLRRADHLPFKLILYGEDSAVVQSADLFDLLKK